jgi:hypothetical protein
MDDDWDTSIEALTQTQTSLETKRGRPMAAPVLYKSPKKNTRVNNTYLPAGGGM